MIQFNWVWVQLKAPLSLSCPKVSLRQRLASRRFFVVHVQEGSLISSGRQQQESLARRSPDCQDWRNMKSSHWSPSLLKPRKKGGSRDIPSGNGLGYASSYGVPWHFDVIGEPGKPVLPHLTTVPSICLALRTLSLPAPPCSDVFARPGDPASLFECPRPEDRKRSRATAWWGIAAVCGRA